MNRVDRIAVAFAEVDVLACARNYAGSDTAAHKRRLLRAALRYAVILRRARTNQRRRP